MIGPAEHMSTNEFKFSDSNFLIGPNEHKNIYLRCQRTTYPQIWLDNDYLSFIHTSHPTEDSPFYKVIPDVKIRP